MTPRGVAGWVAVTAGFIVAVSATLLGGRGAPPLYDGVVSNDPYRYLAPSSGEFGGPMDVTKTLPVTSGRSPVIAIHTPEQPPQAQLIASEGALVLPPGTTAITVSIAPVPASVQPANDHVAGNVYRVSVTNQAGATLGAHPEAQVTLALRAPATVGATTFERLSGGTWTTLETGSAGFPGTFETTRLTEFGDFALVAPGLATTGSEMMPIVTILSIATAGVLVLLVAGTLVLWGTRRTRKR
jgi:hypothetical protein